MSFAQPSNLKIIFAGTPKLGAIILEELTKAGFKIKMVLTKSPKPAGRGKKPKETPVKIIAQKYKIPTLSPAKLDQEEFIEKLKKISPDLIVVAAYGKIFPKVILTLPKYGVLNVHPSLLPKYRGPSPIQFAILDGEKKTGITIIKMDENLDEGDIVAQKEIPIDKSGTTASLLQKLAKLGAKLLIDTLPDWFARKIKPKKQNNLKASYTSQLTKADGKINLSNQPTPEKFDRMVRAFYPWPGVWTELQIVNRKSLIVKFLPDKPFLIQPEGRKPMRVKEFLNGYPETKEWIEKLGFVK